MIDYTFDIDTKLDETLTEVWENSGSCCVADESLSSIRKWELFLESFPGVELASYDDEKYITHLTFADESALSMFLLKWG